jgi:hypothetical protein
MIWWSGLSGEQNHILWHVWYTDGECLLEDLQHLHVTMQKYCSGAWEVPSIYPASPMHPT